MDARANTDPTCLGGAFRLLGFLPLAVVGPFQLHLPVLHFVGNTSPFLHFFTSCDFIITTSSTIMSGILDLPPELNAMVMEYLEYEDICLLRASCKQLEHQTFAKFVSRFRQIVILPQASVLHELCDFSQHQRLSRHVHTIEIVSDVFMDCDVYRGVKWLAGDTEPYGDPSSEWELCANEFANLINSGTLCVTLETVLSNLSGCRIYAHCASSLLLDKQRAWGYGRLMTRLGVRKDDLKNTCRSRCWDYEDINVLTRISTSLVEASMGTSAQSLALAFHVDRARPSSSLRRMSSTSLRSLQSLRLELSSSEASLQEKSRASWNFGGGLQRIIDSSPQLRVLGLAQNEWRGDELRVQNPHVMQTANHILRSVHLNPLTFLNLRRLEADAECLTKFFYHTSSSLRGVELSYVILHGIGEATRQWVTELMVSGDSSPLPALNIRGEAPQAIESAFRKALESKGRIRPLVLDVPPRAVEEVDC